MTAPSGTEPDPGQLLAHSLENPFGEHVRDWFVLCMDRFPLWTFRRQSFAGLHAVEYPTTYPLRRFVASLLRDDGVTSAVRLLDPLPAELERRRDGLSRGSVDLPGWVYDPGAERVLRRGGHIFLPGSATDLAFYEPDTEDSTGGYVSPYEDIGRRLIVAVEDLQFGAAGEQGKAKKALKALETKVGAILGAHRRSEGPPRHALRQIAAQGVSLIELCWNCMPCEPSSQTVQVLVGHGSPDSQVATWAARLSLPMLSRPEIEALIAEIRIFTNWRKGDGSYPTPRRFVIWLLAHRLGMKATTLARSAQNTRAVDYHRGRSNPIDNRLRRARVSSR